jgi:hypothetical protein
MNIAEAKGIERNGNNNNNSSSTVEPEEILALSQPLFPESAGFYPYSGG